MKVYHGHGNFDTGWEVDVLTSSIHDNGTNLLFVSKLDPRLRLRNHSPDGLSWGYAGAGPAQLALALCCDVLKDDERALAVYQEFKRHMVQHISKDQEWLISENIVMMFIYKAEAHQAIRRIMS